MKRLFCISLGAVLSVFLVTSGCYTPAPPKKPPEIVHTATNPQFAGLREDLVDIVVLAARPPEGESKNDGPHVRRFRRLVYEGLIEKGYSPLKLTYIDKKQAGETREKRVDPDFNVTRFDEDAVMVLSLNEWDKRFKRYEGGVMVSATLTLIRSKPKDQLWTYEIRHRIYKIPRIDRNTKLTADEIVVNEVVKDLLEELPPRA